MHTTASPGRALIVSENLSVPFDRRVWQESLALRRHGWDVSVICPVGVGRDEDPYEVIEGVEIHRFEVKEAAGGIGGFVREYAVALWRAMRLALTLGRFDVVHLCNPPDLLFVVGLPLKLRGTRVVFDQHDLVPELYLSRFERGKDVVYWATRAMEWITYKVADVVIATNESYKQQAVARGGKAAEDVYVVRSGPDPDRFARGHANPHLKAGKEFLICYVGVMGPQDGVDFALRALADLKARDRKDWRAVFVGAGEAWESMVRLSEDLELEDVVTFTGRIPDADLVEYLKTADIGLAPDPSSPLNDVSTMNKILEYMAVGCPLVSFDLPEARVSAGEAAIYAPANDTVKFADCIERLLDSGEERQARGRIGRERIQSALSWEHSARVLVECYDDVTEADAPDDGRAVQARHGIRANCRSYENTS